MNASPVITTQFALMWMLTPALICLVGIGFGIVTAFRRGDARIPLAVGGLGFVALLFSLPFASPPGRVQSAPIALEHSAGSVMQPLQPMPVNTQVMVVPLLLLVPIGGAIAIGIVAAIRHGKIVQVVAALAVAGILFFMTAFMSMKVQHPAATANYGPVPAVVFPFEPIGEASPREPRAASVSITPTSPAPSQILYTTGNAQPIPIQELPAWRKNPPHEGSLGAGRAKYVLTSQHFATVDEAEAELFQSLAVDVQESFATYNAPAVGWTPTHDDLRVSGIIAERVIETFSVKVGEFENPVHRVSWLIEFDHDKSTVLLQRWEPIEAQRRAKLILSILAGASGVLGVAAMALRRRRDQPVPLASVTT